MEMTRNNMFSSAALEEPSRLYSLLALKSASFSLADLQRDCFACIE